MYGKHHTEETKKKISAATKGRCLLSPESIRKMAETKRGKKMSDEARRHMSESWKKGRVITPEHRAAMIRGRKGIVMGEEWRRHISEGHKGKNMAADNKFHKDVICIETGELFHGVNEAGRKMGISATHISAACKGKRNVAGGYHWKYADEPNTQQNVGSIFDSALARA